MRIRKAAEQEVQSETYMSVGYGPAKSQKQISNTINYRDN